MAEKEEASGKKSWWKGILGAIGGMISGVVVMYLTPWVDKVAKPPKPVANFSVDYDGATVRFHNLSLTRADGWWDFRDGSPPVPRLRRMPAGHVHQTGPLHGEAARDQWTAARRTHCEHPRCGSARQQRCGGPPRNRRRRARRDRRPPGEPRLHLSG